MRWRPHLAASRALSQQRQVPSGRPALLWGSPALRAALRPQHPDSSTAALKPQTVAALSPKQVTGLRRHRGHSTPQIAGVAERCTECSEPELGCTEGSTLAPEGLEAAVRDGAAPSALPNCSVRGSNSSSENAGSAPCVLAAAA